MLTGKSPSGICVPTGRSDHMFGNRTEPSLLAPGQSTAGTDALDGDVVEVEHPDSRSKQNPAALAKEDFITCQCYGNDSARGKATMPFPQRDGEAPSPRAMMVARNKDGVDANLHNWDDRETQLYDRGVNSRFSLNKAGTRAVHF